MKEFEEMDMFWEGFELLSICVGEEERKEVKGVKSYFVKNFNNLSEQGIEISALPSILFIKDCKVANLRDPR